VRKTGCPWSIRGWAMEISLSDALQTSAHLSLASLQEELAVTAAEVRGPDHWVQLAPYANSGSAGQQMAKTNHPGPTGRSLERCVLHRSRRV
jgi:hypothetical protein